MKKRRLYPIALVLAGSFQAFAGEDDVQRVAEANTAQWNAAFAKGRVEDIVSLYSPSAMLVQPDGAVSKNSEQIRAFWRNLIEKNSGLLTINVQEAKSGKDDTIITRAVLSDVKSLQNTQHVIKYNYEGVLYSVLKRQSDGSWKAQVQQWSNKGRS